MKLRQLGSDGPMVSAIGLGCMSFAGFFGPTEEATSFACLDAARDHGITFLDTANVYGPGTSEAVIGRWLASRTGAKDRMVIATKASITRDPARPVNNDPAHLRAELEGSLQRLGVERIDLFYAHRHDPAVPPEDLAGTMKDLIAEGKIGGYGLSEVSPTTLRRAHAVHPCRAVQNEYSLWSRTPDLGLVRACAELGVAFVPFSPLARGAFSDQGVAPESWQPNDFRMQIPRFQPPNWAQNKARIAELKAHAASRGVTLAALAMAWVLDRGPHLLPIPGTRTAAHLAEWVGAADLQLTPEDRAAIERIMPAGWAWGDRYSTQQAATVERYC